MVPAMTSVRWLLKNPNVDPSSNYEQLVCVFRKKHWNIIKLLIKDPRVDKSFGMNFPLRLFRKNEQWNLLTYLETKKKMKIVEV